jgi:hypothetical protein
MHFKWVWCEMRAKALAGGRKILNGCRFVSTLIVVGFFVARCFWYNILKEFYVHVTVHRNKFHYNKTN